MKLSSLLLGLALGLVASGCKDSGPKVSSLTEQSSPAAAAKTAPPSEAPRRIGLVMKTLTNPFFVEMEKGARRAAQEDGVELLVKTAAQETSIEQQIQAVEDMIQARVAAIVIAPGDSQRMVPVLKKAQQAAIKIVNLDNRLDAETMKAHGVNEVPFISINNEKAAYEVTRQVSAPLTRPTQAVIIEGIRSADNAQQRKNGALRALKENRHLQLVAMESANWKIEEAHDVVAQLFRSHPGIGLIVCGNDMMAIGAMKYLQDSQRRNVQVIGFDALDEAVRAVKSGQLAATVDQQAAEQGYQGIKQALRLLRGESVPAEIMVEAQIIRAVR